MRAVMQWIHLVAAVLAVGGTAFLRLVLLPSFVSLDQQARGRIMAGVARRFFPILWASIAALLASGLYNVVLALPVRAPIYHGILGLKILLALVVFGIALALTLPLPALGPIQRRRPLWLAVNLVLAALVILLSAALRRL